MSPEKNNVNNDYVSPERKSVNNDISNVLDLVAYTSDSYSESKDD